jgi:hypothetical protein
MAAKHGTDDDVKLRCRVFSRKLLTTDINIKDLKHEAESDLWLLVDAIEASEKPSDILLISVYNGIMEALANALHNRYTPDLLGLGGEEDDFEIESG